MSDSLQPHGCGPPGSSVHGDSPGKKTGVGFHDLLQGIFLTHGLNPYLPNPGTEPRFPALQADSLQSHPSEKPEYYTEFKLNYILQTGFRKVPVTY